MRVIVTPASKGGVGKTSTCLALAQAGVYRGKKILAIDLDPQGSFSFGLGADTAVDSINAYNLIMGAPAKNIQATAQGVDVIPSVRDLATLTSEKGSARRLYKALKPLNDKYDFCIIDVPTKAGELLFNGLQTATDVILPVEASIFGLQSLYQINDIISQIKETNPLLWIDGFILTRYGGRSNLEKQMKEAITDRAKLLHIPYLGAIRKGVAIEEATALQQSLYKYAPNGNPAKDYLLLFDSIDK